LHAREPVCDSERERERERKKERKKERELAFVSFK
jgi:hypothetical protein